MLKVVGHGGSCCGMYHIHQMGLDPNQNDVELVNGRMKPLTTGGYYHGLFNRTVPAEPLKDRLKRLVEFIDDIRPNGILEVVLAVGPFRDQSKWNGPLLDLGFKVVNECHNSNSLNRIRVYHRSTDKEA